MAKGRPLLTRLPSRSSAKIAIWDWALPGTFGCAVPETWMVAGWMIRRDVEADLWRVQHL